MVIVSQAVLSNQSLIAIGTEWGGYFVRHSEYYAHTPQELIELDMFIVNQGHKLKREETKAHLQIL